MCTQRVCGPQLLNCIMDMVEKTRRSLTVLRRCQEADREELNYWIRRYSDAEDLKKSSSSSTSQSRQQSPATQDSNPTGDCSLITHTAQIKGNNKLKESWVKCFRFNWVILKCTKDMKHSHVLYRGDLLRWVITEEPVPLSVCQRSTGSCSTGRYQATFLKRSGRKQVNKLSLSHCYYPTNPHLTSTHAHGEIQE